jgi:hypothetical protein
MTTPESKSIDITELERPDDLLGWRPLTTENPVEQRAIDALPSRPGRLAAGPLHLPAKQANDIFVVEHAHAGHSILRRKMAGRPFDLLSQYQPLARQLFVLFFGKIGPMTGDLLAFGRVLPVFLESRLTLRQQSRCQGVRALEEGPRIRRDDERPDGRAHGTSPSYGPSSVGLRISGLLRE